MILGFMNSIDPEVFRGGEKWMVNICVGLSKRGHRVWAIGKHGAIWLQRAQRQGVLTREACIRGDIAPFLTWRLVRFFRREGIDVLCCNFEKDLRIGGLAARIAGTPLIVSRKGLSLIYDTWRYRWVHRHVTDIILTPAAFIKKRFQEYPWLDSRKVHVVPNGVEISPVQSPQFLKDHLRLGNGTRVILAAGILSRQKGFDHALRAFASLDGAVLAIAGHGPERKNLEQLTDNLGIKGRVFFLGHRDDLPRLLAECDIFLLSSKDEGLPNVVLEAMAAGKPVVATDAGGIREVVHHGETGFVVPRGDERAITEKIDLLLKNPSLVEEMGRKGRERVVKHFSLDAMVDGVEHLFERELKRRESQKEDRRYP